jgi:tetratricopeptide (TPR) repeat protein
MSRNGRVAPVVVALALIVAVAFHGAARADAHDSIHRVVELWLDGKDDEARQAAERGLRRRDLDVETRAMLHNLDARIIRLQARQGRGGLSRLEVLSEAEYRAALALRAAPMNAMFWRDHLAIAVEAKGSREVEGLLSKPWHYGRQDPPINIFQTPEYRAIARAMLQVIDGHHRAAITQLRSSIAQRRGEDCTTRVVLSQILQEVGQLDDALRTIDDASGSCNRNSFVSSLKVDLTATRDARRRKEPEVLVSVPAAGESIDVTAPDHRADYENVVLHDPSRLDQWFFVWELLYQERYAEYRKVIRLARSIEPSTTVDIAELHGQIGRGEFRQALETATALIARHPEDRDGQLHLARLLVGAALRNSKREHARDLDVVRADTELASDLRHEQVEYCLERDPHCVLGAVVRRRADSFPAVAYRRGWPIYAPADGPLYTEWMVAEEAADRLDGETRLRKEMHAELRSVREQVAAVQSRIDLIVLPRVERLEQDVRDGKIRQAQMDREVEKLRRDTTAELNRLAKGIAAQKTIMDGELALSRDEVRKLSIHVAANAKALELDGERFANLFDQYVRTKPKEATILLSNIIEKLERKQGADQDVAVLLESIKSECSRHDSPVPCFRALMRGMGRYLKVEVPVIPGVVSFDILAASDTIYEMVDRVTKELGLTLSIPPPKRRS